MADDGQIVAIIKNLTQFTERLVKKITLDVAANLIELTPVDTGWARANWVPSVTASFDGNRDFDHSFHNREGKLQSLSKQTTIQGKGLADVSAYKLSEGMTFVTNNVPYIQKLNSGSSAKAPRLFVQQAIERAVVQNANLSESSV